MNQPNTEPSAADKQDALQTLREHRNGLIDADPYQLPRHLAESLREKAAEMQADLGPWEVSRLVQERGPKRGLVMAEDTDEYLRHRLRFWSELDPREARQRVKYEASENCAVEVPDERIRALMAEGEEPDEVGTLMADVESEEVRWLWDRRIPLGKLTVLDGDPGLGKSVITMDLAARVTAGRDFPNGNLDHVGNLDHLGDVDHVGGVVIISAEDGLADTIRPRLDAAGADPFRVVAISTVPDREGNERTMSIPHDIPTIESAISRVSAKLVVIDPLMAFLSGKANYDQDVRKALTPLARMAESTCVAVLVVRHLNKQQGGKALYRGGSSIGIIGAARSGLVVEQHPENENLRVLATTKSNLAEKAPSLTYSIYSAENGSAKVGWGKATELNADDILDPENSKLDEAKNWLLRELATGPVSANDIKTRAKGSGIKEKTLNRAKDVLSVESVKDGPNGSWRWHLEGSQDGQGGQHGQGSQDSQPPLRAVK